MSISYLTLLSDTQDSIQLDMQNGGDTSNSPYIAKKVTGIDADEIIPKFYSFNIDGDKKFYDLGLKPRNVAILIQLNPRFHLGEDHKYLRDELYKYILRSRTGLVEIRFDISGSTMARLYGFITKFEAPQFSKTPTVTLTLTCNDPMFRSPVPTVYNAAALAGTPAVSGSSVLVSDNISTAPHGFVVQSTVIGSSPPNPASWTIQDVLTDPEWSFTVNFPCSVGDVIRVSSEFGNKYVTHTRGAVVTNLMNVVDPNSVWPVIFPGANKLFFNGTVDTSGTGATQRWRTDSISFNPAFWGL